MTTWPSSNKAVTTTTDQAQDRIDLAREDINKTISNVNDIIDIFNIPSSPTDNYILKYNASTQKFDVEPDAEGTSTIGTHDIWVPAQAMYPTADGGCSNITTVEIVEDRPELRVLDFDQSTTEYAQFSIAMPKSWNEGTITFEVYWAANDAVSGGVSWGLQGVAVANDEVIGSTYGTAQVVDDTFIATTDLHITPTSSALTIAGSGGGTPTAGDLTFFQIYRDTADANDTMAADARLIGIKIHYTTESGTDD